MEAQWQHCLWSNFLTSRGSLERTLNLNHRMRGEKAKLFHQECAFENLWFCQMFSHLMPKPRCSLGRVTVEAMVGESKDILTSAPLQSENSKWVLSLVFLSA